MISCGAVADADDRSSDADSLQMEFYGICASLMQTPLNYELLTLMHTHLFQWPFSTCALASQLSL